ncbi:hypothetical protein ACHWQZ_G001411 [Mnemiopsis leidyi]
MEMKAQLVLIWFLVGMALGNIEPEKPIGATAASDLNSFYNSMLDKYMQPGFWHGFFVSLAVIIVSEIGDKTFFIAAIMAMKHPRMLIFSAAIGALIVMTILSVVLGFLTTVIPQIYTFYAATFLFVLFGLRMLYEGYYMSDDEGQEELEEVQMELKKKEEEIDNHKTVSDLETGHSESPASSKPTIVNSILKSIFSPIFVTAFTMTFLAEWGDRSQITTIILSSREDPWGVCIGGCFGHSLCTAGAVIGGRMIAQRISVRTVTLIGGVVFLMFAVSSLYRGPG